MYIERLWCCTLSLLVVEDNMDNYNNSCWYSEWLRWIASILIIFSARVDPQPTKKHSIILSCARLNCDPWHGLVVRMQRRIDIANKNDTLVSDFTLNKLAKSWRKNRLFRSGKILLEKRGRRSYFLVVAHISHCLLAFYAFFAQNKRINKLEHQTRPHALHLYDRFEHSVTFIRCLCD